MTAQANAYYANKLKERELNEVKIPEVGLKQRSLEEVDIPKTAIERFKATETQRSNLANEDIKRRQLAEEQRYHDLSHDIDVRSLNIKENTTLTRPEQLDKEMIGAAGSIFSKGDLKNLYGMANWNTFLTAADKYYGDVAGKDTGTDDSPSGEASAPGAQSNPTSLDVGQNMTNAISRFGEMLGLDSRDPSTWAVINFNAVKDYDKVINDEVMGPIKSTYGGFVNQATTRGRTGKVVGTLSGSGSGNKSSLPKVVNSNTFK